MKKICSCYVPNITNNLYSDNVKRLLNENDIEVFPIKRVFSDYKLFMRCKIFNFNWFDIVNTKRDFLIKIFVLTVLRLLDKKIIYTVHNKHPHNMDDNKLSMTMMKILSEKSDVIVGLCPETRNVISAIAPACLPKLKYVLHPNYIFNYKDVSVHDFRDRFGFSKDDFVILFIGFISPYKNLELLIDVFKELKMANIKLLIAGKPYSDDYHKKILNKIVGIKNIKYDLRYIPDNEIPSFYATSNIVIMPYGKSSSLNSGAIYLSFSLKKTVICPDIGTVKALQDNSFVYWYEYNDVSDHTERLRGVIQEVYRDYQKNPEIITCKGECAFKYINTIHSDENVRTQYLELYEELADA